MADNSPSAPPEVGRARRVFHLWCRIALVAIFLAWFAQFYRPGFGFSYVLMFNQGRAATIVDTLKGVPIYLHPGVGYDGLFYAQLAVDPLLTDPSIDVALDAPPFRARRILFSWTAWALGLGKPAWIIQAYAVQNVLCWLLLAFWLSRRFPAANSRDLLIWCACLFCPGWLDSARRALIDGPSLLVVALGIDALERGRFWIGSAVLGLAGLARETSLLSSLAVLPRRSTGAAIARSIAGLCLVALPSLVWFDYLRSIYRSTVTQSLDQLSAPFVAYFETWHRAFAVARGAGWISVRALPLLALIGITAQAVHILIISHRRWREPWWSVGVAFVGLMLVVRGEIWLGAYQRVLLPLTFAFNLSLPRGQGFWLIFVLGNLGLATSLYLLMTPVIAP